MATKKDQAILDGTAEGEILTRLTERVEKAVATIQQLRKERDEIRKKLDAAESKLAAQQTTQMETAKAQSEREEIRNRIQNVLKSLEALEE